MEKETSEEKKAYLAGLIFLTIVALAVFSGLIYRSYKEKKVQKKPQVEVKIGEEQEVSEPERFGTPTEKPQTASEKPEKGKNYLVKSGDTLYSIGKAAGIDWLKIAEANNLSEPYTLKVGQVLVIPSE